MKYIWMVIASVLLCEQTFADETPPCYVYDATAILGFGKPDDKPLPGPMPGEIVLRYGGWSMQQLEESPAVKTYLAGSTWGRLFRDQKPESTADEWYTKGVAPGIYRLRLVVLETKNKSRDEQLTVMKKDEEEALVPVVLAASALVVHRIQTSETLLVRDNVRILQGKDKDWPHVTVIRCGTALATKKIEWDPLNDHKSLLVENGVAAEKHFTVGMGFAKKLP